MSNLLNKIFNEEDLFPREIASYEEREYGILFYNEENKDSYDSNHALIYRDKISDLEAVIKDVTNFYKNKGVRPIIYQSVNEEGFFDEIKDELAKNGFECMTEMQKYMILADENSLQSNPDVIVKKVVEWKDEYGTEIFEKAGEPWGIDVVKKAVLNDNTIFFVAFYNGSPVGMTYGHITDGVCRVDYLLVSKEYRNIGVGRAIINSFVEYFDANKIANCYLWPDGEIVEKKLCIMNHFVQHVELT